MTPADVPDRRRADRGGRRARAGLRLRSTSAGPPTRSRCSARLLAACEVSDGWAGGLAGAAARARVRRPSSTSEDLVTYPRSIAASRSRVLPAASERAGQVKVSLRGKGDVDVNASPHRFGGGGHENAAGCTLPGTLDRGDRARCWPRCGEAARRAAGRERRVASRSGILLGRQGARRRPRSRSVAHRPAPPGARAADRPRRHARSGRHRRAARSCSARPRS